MMGQRKAPAMPDEVAVIESKAVATVPILSSVLAKSMAVPETVAMESESKNHATRKRTTCRSLTAILIVFQTEDHAKITYVMTRPRRPVVAFELRSGGPGRSRSHKAHGIVNTAHHRPTRKSTSRNDVDADEKEKSFDRLTRRRILSTCTKTAAA